MTQSEVKHQGRIANWLLPLLLAEKVLQHAFVTWALATDSVGIRDDLAVDPRWLAITGGIVGVLFAVALIGYLTGHIWSVWLAGTLALFDIVGEFIAQGGSGFTVTLSFVIAIGILIVSVREVVVQR
jgi:hypothetical protein